MLEGPPLGPGGEDITWPDQVAPRGRKASSTRKNKPQTSNFLCFLFFLLPFFFLPFLLVVRCGAGLCVLGRRVCPRVPRLCCPCGCSVCAG